MSNLPADPDFPDTLFFRDFNNPLARIASKVAVVTTWMFWGKRGECPSCNYQLHHDEAERLRGLRPRHSSEPMIIRQKPGTALYCIYKRTNVHFLSGKVTIPIASTTWKLEERMMRI